LFFIYQQSLQMHKLEIDPQFQKRLKELANVPPPTLGDVTCGEPTRPRKNSLPFIYVSLGSDLAVSTGSYSLNTQHEGQEHTNPTQTQIAGPTETLPNKRRKMSNEELREDVMDISPRKEIADMKQDLVKKLAKEAI